jgi:NADPH:quinone reductase-like Zn-dependent oxidoreductase
MKTMNVMRFNDSAEAPALIPFTAPIPEPKKGEIVIKVHAAGVTPTELQWYPTTHTPTGEARTGAIPGHEFSGVVAAVGPDADPQIIGSEVFGMNDWFAEGASAEYCVTVGTSVASKPSGLAHAAAATVPISALTAWQGLFDHAKLCSGERVLIHGGSGAVGMYAIQLARRIGAHVITTASARNVDFLRELGANEVIDYGADRFEEHAHNLDVVFDAVGGDTLARSWHLLSSGGRVVTIATNSEGTSDDRIKKAFFIVTPNHDQLKEISGLLNTKEIRFFVDAIVPLDKASDAYCGKIGERKGRGKAVLSLVSDKTPP